LTRLRLDTSAHLKTTATFSVTTTLKPSKPDQIPETLPPIPNLEFFPDSHRYVHKNRLIPWSVTKITSHDKSQAELDAIWKRRSEWQLRGNTVHACLEAFLKGEAQLNPGKYAEWVEPLLEHRLWRDYGCIASEHRMVSPCGLVAGSCDAVLSNGTKTLLVDLKTVSSASRSPYSTDRQMGAYTWLLNANHKLYVDHCVTVWAAPGSVRLTVAEPDACYAAWDACFEQFKLKQEAF